jgi:hypothetical protein
VDHAGVVRRKGPHEQASGELSCAVAITLILNGWVLMQHLSLVAAHEGFIAAVLLANMLPTPIVMWAAFVVGEVAEGSRSSRGLAGRSGSTAPQNLHDYRERKNPTWVADFC